MPNIQVTVCVIALTQGDHKALDPAFQPKLAGFFASSGKPYDKSSPDDWRPFNADSVSDYLKNAGIEPSFRTVDLNDKAKRSQALKDTRLYIIDPLVLLHTVRGATLSGSIQDAIFQGSKAFCIVLPDESLGPVRKDIEAWCQSKLSDLWTFWKGNDDADDVDVVYTHEHLKKYLKGLARLLDSQPNQDTYAIARQILILRGVAAPNLPQPPSLGRS